MNKLLLAGIGMLAMTGAAEAACSTSSMPGSWRTIGQDNVCTAKLSTSGVISGVTCSDGSNYSGTLTLNSSCVLGGSISGNAIKGRTNPIAASSATLPTLMIGASTNGKIAFTGFKL